MPLVLVAVTPPSGPAGVATPVSVECQFLTEPLVLVQFRGVDATEVSFVSSTEFTCKVPPLSAGTADLLVTDRDASAPLDPAYEYLAVLEEPEVAHVATHTVPSGEAEQVAQDGEGTVTASSGAKAVEASAGTATITTSSGGRETQ